MVYNAMLQCNAIQGNAIQYNAIQCNTMQYNAIQYNFTDGKSLDIEGWLGWIIIKD